MVTKIYGENLLVFTKELTCRDYRWN